MMPDRNIEQPVSGEGSYTEPLGLLTKLKSPEIKLDWLPMVDLVVIILLFSLLFTRFVMVPGVRVDLPESELQMQPTTNEVAVLTVGNRGMLFFDGSVFELNTIQQGFKQYMDTSSRRDVILLLKTEGTMDLQVFLELCRMAQDAGFMQLQIAGKNDEEGEPSDITEGAMGASEASFLSN